MSVSLVVAFSVDPSRSPHALVAFGFCPGAPGQSLQPWAQVTIYTGGDDGVRPARDAAMMLAPLISLERLRRAAVTPISYGPMWALVCSPAEYRPGSADPESGWPAGSLSGAGISPGAPDQGAVGLSPATLPGAPSRGFMGYGLAAMPGAGSGFEAPGREVAAPGIAEGLRPALGMLGQGVPGAAPPSSPAPCGTSPSADEVYSKVRAYAVQYGSHPDFGALDPLTIKRANNYITSTFGAALSAPILEAVRARLAASLTGR